ncbi:uncharacterized protein C7orf26 homolog [Harmonia axyridis]|uniref:uncharacterized protein C7orf26 homolog n=1 Tax=Harmonia axyridis TaxID=115357 RepID=UPI001E2780FA|nr:uncharacterized protein C7orf26 homolog [Harmonia axyridis]XP_045481656.1 uncharacterized protein C7orf26 homolog [Harmonia axyridis]
MSVTSDIVLKQSLRKLEFPLCAKEALVRIGELVCARATNIKHMDFCLALMSEFIFYEIDRRGNKRTTPLTATSELELVMVLFNYFTSLEDESTRNTVFLSLFTGTTANQRIGVLGKLVSIAAGVQCASILISATAWMQQLGNNSEISCKLADVIVFDYFVLIPSGNSKLSVLPEIAPQFVANFLTASAENYFIEKDENMLFPPTKFLETVTSYISNNNSLCIAAQQNPPILPSGAIAMESNTPIAGLLKWCVLAPLYNQASLLYGELHLALLESILQIPVTNPPKAISAQSLCDIIRSIMSYVTNLKKNKSLNNIIDHEPLQKSLNRLAQAVQIAFSVKCVYGKVDELVSQLLILPYNKLMKIVMNAHKQMK